MLRTSLTTNSSTHAAQIVVEFDGVDAGSGGGKSVKNLSKSRRIVKKPKKPQKSEKLQRPSVWKNVYRGTNLPSIGYKELELLLQLSDNFSSSFCLVQELPRYHFCFDY